MSEFRFFAYTDFAFITNRSQNLVNLPITPFLATKPVTSALASDEPSTELNVPYTVFEILVAIVSIIGNLMVIIVFRRERKLRRRTNYYIVSLAMADFLVGSLGVPFAILASIGLPTNLYACLFTVSLLVVLCTISIFCLVAVSVDRYWAILYPMAYSRNVRTRTAIVIISMCWVAGAVVGFLPLFGWHAEVDHNQACLFVEVMDYNYLVFLYFATIITPALLMLAFYAHIYRVIIKQVRQIVTMNPASDLSRRSSTAQIQISTPGRVGCHGGTMLRVLGAARKRDVKATQNLSIIVLFFMICWIPLYTINCIKAFCPSCYVHPKLTLFCIILSHLNSAVNPVLYAYHLKDFRAALKSLLLKLMGIEIDQQAEAIHRFSLASQHRLQSMDSRSMQPRMYIDSPIWLRQQQEALKNSQLLPKCGVVSPCFNNIHQTVAAVASVTTDIEREMWNIVEASSGAEHGEVSYEFHSDKVDSDRDSSMSPSKVRRTSKQMQQQRHQRRYDSTYSYDNHNFSSSNDDNDDENNDDSDVQYEDVFIANKQRNPNAPVDPNELRKSLIACVMREKLRSDDTEHQVHKRTFSGSYYADIIESQRNSINTCTTSPTNGQLTMGSALCRDNTESLGKCLPAAAAAVAAATAAVYVIDSDTHPLHSPGHKPKYRKPTTLPKNSHEISRSCSCTSESASPAGKEVAASTSPSPSPLQVSNNSLSSGETLTRCANSTSQKFFSNKNHHLTFHTFSSNSIPKQQQQQQQQQQQNVDAKRQFSPLRTVGNFMFQPISKHSSLFHIFQVNSTTAPTLTPATTTQPTKTIAKTKAISSLADLREAATVATTTPTTTSSCTMASTTLNAKQEPFQNDIKPNATPTASSPTASTATPPALMASTAQLPCQLPSLVNSNNNNININTAISATDADSS